MDADLGADLFAMLGAEAECPLGPAPGGEGLVDPAALILEESEPRRAREDHTLSQRPEPGPPGNKNAEPAGESPLQFSYLEVCVSGNEGSLPSFAG